jgi:MFS family permease
MKPARWHELLVLNTYWLGLSFMWNGLHVIILPAVLLNYVPAELKNTALGMLTFTGLIIAMLVQPLSGALSDRWVSRWGRRRPLILLGTLGDFVFLAILGWAGGLPWLALGYIGLQFSSNMAHGPMQGLMPDQLPPEQLGAGSGFKNLIDMLGMVVSSLFLGRLFDPDAAHPSLPLAVIIGVLAAGAAVTLIGVREKAALRTNPPADAAPKPPRPSVQLTALFQHGALTPYARLIIARFAFLLAVYGIQTFAQYYVQDVLKAADPPKLTGDLLAAIAVSLIIFALLGGWLGDRLGHIRMHYVAGAIATLGSLLMLFARTPLTLLIFGSVFGIGIGLFLTANWALASLLAPPGEAGKYLGLTNIATAGSAAVGRLLGPLIDLANNARPGGNLGYYGLFVFGAVCALGSIFLIRRVKTISQGS